MMPPMPFAYLARMSQEDLEAIVLYLRSRFVENLTR